MAGEASICMHGGGMAGAAGCAAMMDAAAMFIHRRLGMRQIEDGRLPRRGVVTRLALRSKRARMEGRIGVTGDAGCGRAFVNAVGMAS